MSLYLEGFQKLDTFSHLEVYGGKYGDLEINVFTLLRSLDIRDIILEDPLEKYPSDLIIRIGYCFATPRDKPLEEGEYVLLKAMWCSDDWSASAKRIKAHPSLVSGLKKLSESMDLTLSIVECCSFRSWKESLILNDSEHRYHCFDKLGFDWDLIIKRRRIEMVSLCRVKYPLMGQNAGLMCRVGWTLDDLIKLSLEFCLDVHE